MTELTVLANRLPIEPTRDGNRWRRSPGGLAAALHPTLAATGGRWIGWAGGSLRGKRLPTDLGYDVVPVDLPQETIQGYYDGMSNATLWPLYHDRVRPSVQHRDWWRSYVNANTRFAETAIANTKPGDVVWVHDYHLQLVPAMLKQHRPDLRIGFYLHIPFPSPDLFMTMSWRREIIEGIAGADVIGFQTPIDVDNFRRTVERLNTTGAMQDRSLATSARVAAFPISVDVERWDELANRPGIDDEVTDLRRQLGSPRHLLLGVDRLDYTKGIEERLHAFRELLESGALTAPDTVLVQVAVPSRDRTTAYRRERIRIEQLVGQINGEFGEIGAPAVHYIHRSYSPEEIAALYRAADVMLVTPLRDGMNLVAKEFVMSRVRHRGVLLLSEFAGASHELTDAVLVNPYDIESLKQGILRALNLPDHDVVRRMNSLRAAVRRNSVHDWAQRFLDRLALEAVA